MENKMQYKNSEIIPKNIFVGFGKVLFIYAWIYAIANILDILVFSTSDNGFFVSFNYFSLFAGIASVSSLVFVVRNGRKIRSNFHHLRSHFNDKINLFYFGLIIWLIRYSAILLMILTYDFPHIFGIIFSIIGGPILSMLIVFLSYLYEIITWIFLGSFFISLKNLASLKTWRQTFTSAMILVVAAIMQILAYFSELILSIDPYMGQPSPMDYLIAYILHYVTVSLFIIGFFVLSISLIREKISLKGDNNYYNTRNGNLTDNNNISAQQKKICEYCGHPIEHFMDFCPKCGNPLSP